MDYTFLVETSSDESQRTTISLQFSAVDRIIQRKLCVMVVTKENREVSAHFADEESARTHFDLLRGRWNEWLEKSAEAKLAAIKLTVR